MYLPKSIILLLFLVLVISCSKDDKNTDNNTPEEKEFQEIAPIEEDVMALLPEGLINSTDPNAQSTISLIESALSWTSFQDQLIPPQEATLVELKSASTSSEVTYTWKWKYTYQYTMTMYWTYKEDDQKEYWEILIQYNDGPKYKYLEAWQSKTGVQGQLIYNFAWICAFDDTEVCDELNWTYNWNMDASGNYHFSFTYAGTELADYLKYDVDINADGSGTIDYYSLGILYYHAEWDAIGNGSYIYYSGASEISGTWTVE